jgi:hypothetical protein
MKFYASILLFLGLGLEILSIVGYPSIYELYVYKISMRVIFILIVGTYIPILFRHYQIWSHTKMQVDLVNDYSNELLKRKLDQSNILRNERISWRIYSATIALPILIGIYLAFPLGYTISNTIRRQNEFTTYILSIQMIVTAIFGIFYLLK